MRLSIKVVTVATSLTWNKRKTPFQFDALLIDVFTHTRTLTYTHLHARTNKLPHTHHLSLSLNCNPLSISGKSFFSAQELPEAPHVSVFLEMKPAFVGKWLWSSFVPVINPINYVNVFKAEERRRSSVKPVINPINHVKYFKLTRCRNIEEFIRLQMTVQYYQRYIDSVAQSSPSNWIQLVKSSSSTTLQDGNKENCEQ